jgi:hypothetical protein
MMKSCAAALRAASSISTCVAPARPSAILAADGVVEERGFLRDERDRNCASETTDVAHVLAVDADGAAGDVVEARQQVEDGGLAGARGADEGDGFAGLDGEAHVLERRRVAVG